MRTIWGLILASGLLWTAVASAADAPGAEAVDRGFRETVRPFSGNVLRGLPRSEAAQGGVEPRRLPKCQGGGGGPGSVGAG